MDNRELSNASLPVLYMVNQSSMVGLDVVPSNIEWNQKKLKSMTPTDSMNWFYWILEQFPFQRLTYADSESTTWWVIYAALSNLFLISYRMPHMSQGRIIKPGQKVHASFCFMDPKGYTPKATFDPELAGKISWEKIIGVGRIDDTRWADEIEEFIEKDLFDVSCVPDLVRKGIAEPENHDWGGRLVFLASTRTSAVRSSGDLTHLLKGEGAQAILREESTPELLWKMARLNSNRTWDIISGLSKHGMP